MIRNHGNHLNWNSKTAAEGKNRVNITVKNRVHTGHKLSMDDGYCIAGFREKNFHKSQGWI